jgi:hypothetical protein
MVRHPPLSKSRTQELERLLHDLEEFQQHKNAISDRYVVPESPGETLLALTPNPIVSNEIEVMKQFLRQQTLERESRQTTNVLPFSKMAKSKRAIPDSPPEPLVAVKASENQRPLHEFRRARCGLQPKTGYTE